MEEGIEQLVSMVANMKVMMEEKFAAIEKKLAEHDERFESIEKKLVEHDEQFEKMGKKLDGHNKRFDKIEEKFTQTIRLIGHDVQNNKRHIDHLENGEDYYKISE